MLPPLEDPAEARKRGSSVAAISAVFPPSECPVAPALFRMSARSCSSRCDWARQSLRDQIVTWWPRACR